MLTPFFFFFFRYAFHSRVTAVACKRPGHSAKSAGGKITAKHAYTLDPTKWEWADYMLSRHSVGIPQGNELTRNSSGKARSRLFQVVEPHLIDHWPERVELVCARLFPLKKKSTGG